MTTNERICPQHRWAAGQEKEGGKKFYDNGLEENLRDRRQNLDVGRCCFNRRGSPAALERISIVRGILQTCAESSYIAVAYDQEITRPCA